MDKTDNIDKIKLYKKQWAETNRQKIVEAKRRYYEKMKNDPEFMENLRQKAKERYIKKKENEKNLQLVEKQDNQIKPRGR